MNTSSPRARLHRLLPLGIALALSVGGVAALAQEPDTVPPETTITFGPSAPSGASWVVFAFSSSESNSSFSCSLDGSPFDGCTSPLKYEDLSDGAHTFRVRATDPAGNTDPTPAALSWTIDTVPPDTEITSGPSGMTHSANAVFAFAGSEPGTTFGCSMDADPFVNCTSPTTYTALQDGSHTFAVRAVDGARNVDPSPPKRTWIVDARGPQIAFERPVKGVYVNNQTVVEGGPATIVVGSLTVHIRVFDGQSGVASLRIEVNGVPVEPSNITSQGDVYRFTFAPPAAGEHTIGVLATNGSGLSEGMAIKVFGVPV